jgi:hypothetical protein
MTNNDNSPKKLDKNATDKPISVEQTIVNATLTQAAAMLTISEILADIADSLDVLRIVQVKSALKSGVISEEESLELLPTDDSEESDESTN